MKTLTILTTLISLICISPLAVGQGLDSQLSLAGPIVKVSPSSPGGIEDPFAIKREIPSDLEIINSLGIAEFTSLEGVLDTMGLDFDIIDKTNGRYFVDIEGAESNIKSWEIATVPNGTNHEKVVYILIRYYHDNEGDLTDFERYSTKRKEKLNERKFTYNKSEGRNQSYIAVQIQD